MTNDSAGLTREESAWLLALARDRVQEHPGAFSIPEAIRYSLLAKGCISLGSPLQLTALGLAAVARGPDVAADESAARAPVFLVSVALPKRDVPGDVDSAAAPGPEAS